MFTMPRKSPVKHKVNSHSRKGKKVVEHTRGKEKKLTKPFIGKVKKTQKVPTRVFYNGYSKVEMKEIPIDSKIDFSMYQDPKNPEAVDSKIFPLVVLLNKKGIRTSGSCQGHYMNKEGTAWLGDKSGEESDDEGDWWDNAFVTIQTERVKDLDIQDMISSGEIKLDNSGYGHTYIKFVPKNIRNARKETDLIIKKFSKRLD